jgi:7-carboxy-7-deazaguanine synthase
MVSLRITEIFCSLQGESSLVGLPTVFVRLTGCPLRCSYCDTSYAFKGGETRALDSILGEPLAQRDCLELLVALCDAGYRVSLETSGALDIADVDDRVKRVMDIKTPSSGEVDRNLWSNLELLTSDDEVKFVIADRDDYDWSKALLLEHALLSRCCVLFSPVYEALEARKLADWIVADRLPVRFQIQLHKLLWGDRPGV